LKRERELTMEDLKRYEIQHLRCLSCKTKKNLYMVVGRIYDFFHVVCEVCIAPYLYDDAVWKKKFEIYKIEFTFTDPSV
jgi:hypothetical protein